MRPIQIRALGTLLTVSLLGATSGALAQDAAAKEKDSGAGLRTGPATIAPHWSKYKYPESIPEGAAYHIVERGDTLWDLSKRYLNNPFLWPQVWDKNRYITDAHWIYPGDPIIFPDVALLAGQAGAGPGAGTGEDAGTGLGADEGLGPEGAAGGRGVADLYPATEEHTLQCAAYLVRSSENDNLQIIGAEQGNHHVAYADREILYLNKGSNAGVKVGDVYSAHHEAYKVKHPNSGRALGTKIETTGWVRVLLVTENSATAIVEQACIDIHAGDYLKPFEKVTVPLLARHLPPDRLTPPSGKASGVIVDSERDRMIMAEGHMVHIDLGSQDGIAPGNLFTVYRITYPSVPTSRNVIGELAVLSAEEKTSLARVTYSNDGLMIGDRIELR